MKKITTKAIILQPRETSAQTVTGLPAPAALVFEEETIKVTLALKKSSVEFFKREADKHQTKYQKMIRELVDKYAVLYQ